LAFVMALKGFGIIPISFLGTGAKLYSWLNPPVTYDLSMEWVDAKLMNYTTARDVWAWAGAISIFSAALPDEFLIGCYGWNYFGEDDIVIYIGFDKYWI